GKVRTLQRLKNDFVADRIDFSAGMRIDREYASCQVEVPDGLAYDACAYAGSDFDIDRWFSLRDESVKRKRIQSGEPLVDPARTGTGCTNWDFEKPWRKAKKAGENLPVTVVAGRKNFGELGVRRFSVSVSGNPVYAVI